MAHDRLARLGMPRHWAALCVLLAAAACGETQTVETPDAGGGTPDQGGGADVSTTPDTGPAVDTAAQVDSGPPKGGDDASTTPVDAGQTDGGGNDAAIDAGKPGCTKEICNGLDDDCDGKTDEDSCTDGDSCTTDECNSSEKQCNHSPVAEGGPCDDGSPCTDGDSCKGGKCVAGGAKKCDDGNPCTAGTCDPNEGGCKFANLADGKTCDDNSKCTDKDACKAGKCAGAQIECDDGNGCTTEACDPAAGCTVTNDDGKGCDDGDPCTDKDACASGACKGAAKKCPGGAPCKVAKCDAKTGKCSIETKADVAPCEDGDLCTSGDICIGGACKGGEAKDCTFKSDCLKGYCDNESGKCVATTKEDGAKCTDSDACTNGDTCAKGLCMGKAITCDDKKNCTDDSCDKTKGCVFKPNTAPCDDGDACTLKDACAAGACKSGKAKDCDDKEACTVDVCFKDTGNCGHNYKPPDGKPCAGDGDACTVGDKCDKGKCKIGPPKDCSDGDGCTSDSCDKKTAACGHAKMKPGASCSDGSLCTYKDVCSAEGNCIGVAIPCNDGLGCTKDGCIAKTGDCTFTPIAPGQPCDDGDLCTIGDKCNVAGTCVVGLPKLCTDSNACTKDTCDLQTGKCAFPTFTGPCDDKDSCTQGERCTNGKCATGVDGDVNTVAGTGKGGFLDGESDKAQFQYPRDVAVHKDGTAVVADHNNHRIRIVGLNGKVGVLSGSGSASWLDGPGKTARFYYPSGVAIDRSNNTVYVADRTNQRIRIVGTDGKTGTLAGISAAGWKDGPGNQARFNNPEKLAVGPGGIVYVADTGNHRIRKVAPNGVVTTLAGGSAGFIDGKGASARFNAPLGIDVDKLGNVFVADSGNHRLRIVLPDGSVSTLAGSSAGYQNGQGAQARFNSPADVALSPAGYLVLSDRYNYRLRKVTISGMVTNLAGSGIAGWQDGPGASARFQQPWGVGADPFGNILVADTNNHRIRRSSVAKTVCDDGSACTIDSCQPAKGCQFAALKPGSKCEDGTKCTTGDLCDIKGACLGKKVNCDDGNKCTDDLCNPGSGKCTSINNSSPCNDGDMCSADKACSGGACKTIPIIATFTGSGQAGVKDGVGTSAGHYRPRGMDVDGLGIMYVVSYQHHRVRQVTPSGLVTTVAGSGTAGFKDGPGMQARFYYPTDVAVGPANNLYIADRNNHRIRKVAAGMVTTLAGSNSGFADGKGTSARFTYPEGIDVDKAGNIYVADSYNNRIRRITQAGVVNTVAGSSQGYQEGKGTSARFYRPGGVAVDAAGTIYVADTNNHRIRRVQPDGTTQLLAGAGKAGFNDAYGGAAMFYYPRDLAVAPGGDVYVADSNNNRVRAIDGNGGVTTAAGNGKAGYNDGKLDVAMLNYPAGVAVSNGALYIADYNNHRLRTLKANKKICNDFNACTNDSCDPKTGKCKFLAIPNCCSKEKLWLHFNDKGQSAGLEFASCAASTSYYSPKNCKSVSGAPGGKGWQVWTSPTSSMSQPGALYYGNPSAKNYNWGASAGTVRTPKVAVPAGAASLDLWFYYDTEGGTKYDQFKAFLIVDGVRVSVGAVLAPNEGAFFQKGQAPWTKPKSWFNVKTDISKWAGKVVQLEFYFNSGDTIGNATLGVLVDDVKILGTCPK